MADTPLHDVQAHVTCTYRNTRGDLMFSAYDDTSHGWLKQTILPLSTSHYKHRSFVHKTSMYNPPSLILSFQQPEHDKIEMNDGELKKTKPT